MEMHPAAWYDESISGIKENRYAYFHRFQREKGLHLRYGRCDLPRQPYSAGRGGVHRLAARGGQGVSLSHQQQRLHAPGAEPEAGAHGSGRAGGAFLHQRAGHRRLPEGAGAGLLRVRHRRGGTAKRPLRRGHHHERREPRLCGSGRGPLLFAGYTDQGHQSGDAGRPAHRRQLRRVRPH